jgi:hypothetical protein
MQLPEGLEQEVKREPIAFEEQANTCSAMSFSQAPDQISGTADFSRHGARAVGPIRHIRTARHTGRLKSAVPRGPIARFTSQAEDPFKSIANMPYITGIERLSRQEGHQEGLQEGQSNMLLSLLAVKFGPLGEADRRRVLDADGPTGLDWSTRLLSARTLDEVFVAGPGTDSAH